MIAQLLEKGEPEAAAAVVLQMKDLFPGLPASMPPDEADEARRSLARCVQLEEDLRRQVLASLNRLAATRRSGAYRHRASSP